MKSHKINENQDILEILVIEIGIGGLKQFLCFLPLIFFNFRGNRVKSFVGYL